VKSTDCKITDKIVKSCKTRWYEPWTECPCTPRGTSWAGWCRCAGRRPWTRRECWSRVRRIYAAPEPLRGTGTTTVSEHTQHKHRPSSTASGLSRGGSLGARESPPSY